MSTWSGIRNKLENDYLCPALRGHIQYFATSYSKSADHEGRGSHSHGRRGGAAEQTTTPILRMCGTKFHHLRSTTLKIATPAKEAINQAQSSAA